MGGALCFGPSGPFSAFTCFWQSLYGFLCRPQPLGLEFCVLVEDLTLGLVRTMSAPISKVLAVLKDRRLRPVVATALALLAVSPTARAALLRFCRRV